MISFGGSPRSPRMVAAHLAIGHLSGDGVAIDVIEYGHQDGRRRSGILLTDAVRRDLIQQLGGVPMSIEDVAQ